MYKLLKSFASNKSNDINNAIKEITKKAPFRYMATPYGHNMSVAMTSCGDFGWISNREGYYYVKTDPVSEELWPSMPDLFKDLAISAAKEAGFDNFNPDCCLINRYGIKSRLSLHQDRDEKDFSQPIVSFSFGLIGIFQFGGLERTTKPQDFYLENGDAFVWGGNDRMRYHGIKRIVIGKDPVFGDNRINLTFRKAI
ncbi:MAG: DNA oxidative demethylase AlkB [Thioploca sp.]|nr:DNA oxidative demethylase AlkB [Thioploca sp.]